MSDKIGKTNRPIPDDWRIDSLKSVSLNGAKNGFFKKPELVGSGYKLVNVSELYQSFGIDTRVESVERVAATPADLAKYGVEKGDVFFTRSSLVLSGIAACNIVRQLWEPTLFECHVMKMSPDTSKMFPEFVAYCCRDSYSRRYLMAQAKQTTMTTISQPEIEQLPIPVAPLPEQKKIARILTTLDNLIEKTEALIAKYQAIKQGMMHDLFTRGVDSSGQLRPTQQQAPDLYKQSELGWIPKEWDEDTLGSICKWMSGGTPSKSNESYWTGAIPWVSPKDMKVFEISDSEDHISEEAARVGTRRVPAGTVLIVIRGMILAHSFPVAITTRDVTFNQDMKALSFDDTETARFVAHWFVTHKAKMVALATASSHGTKRFDLADVYSIPIGMPTKEERERIVERIDVLDSKQKAEDRYLSKLRTQKSGLMQDLLTGIVRVKVDEAEEFVANV
ncbi:restriction endonuclease subunit S [Stieleria varia]|uniref:EcoKI restriction-modification system protein HsdS n=1 Tax=Stieleria varia TaxID=2528005 RepID=A0A5C6B7Y8_9BACT|nr:restriction endonuclease subunit S [Stieleria varia]TWU08375.1 EcoKI restriction-modification system protein HsdS [Stieleria varia]